MNREMRRLVEREERRQKQTQQQRRQAARTKRPAGKPAEQKPSLLQRLGIFLREVRTELRRVQWPTREQMIAFTSVTLITTTAVTLIVFAFDVVLKEGILWLLQGAGG
jgi:preprotein translocase subunit SecE